MKVKTARFFVVLAVVGALLLAGPAWAAPEKGGIVFLRGSAPVVASTVLDQNQIQDQVRLEDQEEEEEKQDQEDQLEEEDTQQEGQDEPEGEQNQVENDVEQQTQTEDQAKAQDQAQFKTKAKIKVKEQLHYQEQEEQQEQEQEQEKAEATPANTTPEVTPQHNRVGQQILVNGQLLKDALPPVVKEGTTLVPLRALAATLKAQVAYDATTKTVTMVKQGITIELSLASGTVALKDQLGQEKTISLPVPPQVIEGYTFVPLRFISETFAANVSYDPTTGIITVQEPEAAAPSEQPAAPAPAPQP